MRYILLFMFLLTLAGCGETQELEYQERSVNQIYNEAVDAMRAGNYFQASQLFDEVERQHPYSDWAKQAQIMSAYSHYRRQKYDEAIATLERFIKLHPGSDEISYAYYLRGISYYEQISDVTRDQSMTREALRTLTEVVKRFPGTAYARDAQLKIDLTRDHLAGKEMTIGRYYQEKGEFLAAINRYKVVVKDYDTTTHIQEALFRLSECYMSLGLVSEAQKYAAVLGHNYPGSTWYEKSYNLLVKNDAVIGEADEPGLLKRAWEEVF